MANRHQIKFTLLLPLKYTNKPKEELATAVNNDEKEKAFKLLSCCEISVL